MEGNPAVIQMGSVIYEIEIWYLAKYLLNVYNVGGVMIYSS